jgi:hypothetical protein
MRTDIRSYVGLFANLLDRGMCNEVVNGLNKLDLWKPHYFTDNNGVNHGARSGQHELSFCHIPDNDATEMMTHRVRHAIDEYRTQMNIPWWSSEYTFSGFRFNRYEQGQEMAPHCDHIHSLFDGEKKGVPVLTILGALNDDYSGGELMLCEQPIDMKAGSMLIFPSNFLYPHEVKRVLSGTRYTYVGWAW